MVSAPRARTPIALEKAPIRPLRSRGPTPNTSNCCARFRTVKSGTPSDRSNNGTRTESGSAPAGLPHNELCRQPARCDLLAANQPDQAVDQKRARTRRILANARELGAAAGGGPDVVKPHNRHIAWHAPAAIVDGLDHAHGQQIARRENRVEVLIGGQQRKAGGVTIIRRDGITRARCRSALQPAFCERPPVSLITRMKLGNVLRISTHEDNLAPAMPDEMLSGRVGALLVIAT